MTAGGSQDEEEIERLEKCTHAACACEGKVWPDLDNVGCWCFTLHQHIAEFVSLARRLVKERDQGLRIHNGFIVEAEQRMAMLEKERDEARRLHSADKVLVRQMAEDALDALGDGSMKRTRKWLKDLIRATGGRDDRR